MLCACAFALALGFHCGLVELCSCPLLFNVLSLASETSEDEGHEFDDFH